MAKAIKTQYKAIWGLIKSAALLQGHQKQGPENQEAPESSIRKGKTGLPTVWLP
jgi:hypothetical protein